MKFRLQAEDLNEALNVAALVPPRPITSQGYAGFLFVVEGDICRIHSRDAQQQARSEVAVTDVEGEGSFIYPSDKIKELQFLDGWIEFESGHDEDDDRYWVTYRSEGAAESERLSQDPRLVQSMDEGLDSAGTEFTFQSTLLKEALGVSKGYLAKANDTAVGDHFKILQLFDESKKEWARGDGHMFASDHVRVCYFYCEALKGKGLTIHVQHIPVLLSFLAKSEGEVTVKLGEGVTYVVNSKGWALGWAHHVKTHGKFSYYSHKMDGWLLKVDKDILLKTLRYTRGSLDKRQDKIRVEYTYEDTSLRFRTSETKGKVCSVPVGVVPVEGDDGAGSKGKTDDFAANVNINYLLDLFEPMRSNQAELRVSLIPGGKGKREVVLFRTLEEFWISESGKELISREDTKEEAYQCRVTRFMPSKD